MTKLSWERTGFGAIHTETGIVYSAFCRRPYPCQVYPVMNKDGHIEWAFSVHEVWQPGVFANIEDAKAACAKAFGMEL